MRRLGARRDIGAGWRVKRDGDREDSTESVSMVDGAVTSLFWR